MNDNLNRIIEVVLATILGFVSAILSGTIVLFFEYGVVQPWFANNSQAGRGRIVPWRQSIRSGIVQIREFAWTIITSWTLWAPAFVGAILYYFRPAGPGGLAVTFVAMAMTYAGLFVAGFLAYKVKRDAAFNNQVQSERRSQRLKQFDIAVRRAVAQLNFIELTMLNLQAVLHDQIGGQYASAGVDELLKPAIAYKQSGLGFKEGDLYNFVVYMLAPDKRQLTVLYRNCDPRIVQHNRPWPVDGHSHTATVFAKGELQISGDDVTEGDMIVIEYPTDREYYASYISAPIRDLQSKRPIGVFTITSSRKGHFRQVHVDYVKIIAAVLSIYFSSSWKEDGAGG